MVLPFPGSHGWYTWQPVLPTLGGDWYLHVIKLPETQWRQLDAHKESTIISTRLIFPSVIITTNPIFGKYNIITILSTLRTHTHILLYNNYIYIYIYVPAYLHIYSYIITLSMDLSWIPSIMNFGLTMRNRQRFQGGPSLKQAQQNAVCLSWNWVTGWWLTYPSEKHESQLGWLFPIQYMEK